MALSKAGNDTNKVRILEYLGFAHATIDPEEGIRYNRAGLQLSKQLRWEKGIAQHLAGLGVNYAAKDDHGKALEYYNQALAITEQIKDTSSIAGTYANISLVHMERGEYSKALDFAFKALKVFEQLNDEPHIAVIKENIGTLYFRQKNYPKTIHYYSEALKTYQALGDKRGLARNQGNMGMVYDAQGDYRKALENHKLALQTNEALESRYGIEINLANIGYVYSHLKDYTNALRYQQQALQLSRELASRSSIAINLGNIGETYFAMATDSSASGSFNKKVSLQHSIKYLQEAIAICKELDFYDPMIEYSQYLSDACYHAGNFKAAVEHYKQYTSIKDSVFSVQNQQYIANLEANRELERKNQELKIKDHQLYINELRAETKRDEQIIYVTTILLLLLVVGIGVNRLYIFRKSNKSLVAERQRQLEVIDEQIQSLKAHAKTLEDISYMQAHDVRGPVATIIGLAANFNTSNYADPDNLIIIEGISEVANQLDLAVQEVIKKEKIS